MIGEISGTGFVWVPSEEVKARSRIAAFLRAHGLADCQALRRRADDEPEWFWDAVIRFFDIRFDEPYERVLDLSEGLPWARWCVGGRTNLVLNCLDARMASPAAAKPAIVWEGEDGEVRRWTYAELDAATSCLAGALRALGIGKGDVVGLYMPMLPETAAALLAVAKIGAVALPMFSGFGAAAAAERLRIAEAAAVITVDATRRRGREVPMKAVIDEAAATVPSLRHVVMLRHAGIDVPWRAGRDRDWAEIAAGASAATPTEIVDAEHPLMIMFTSGTSGRPKGTVHTHCGALVKNALDVGLCLDVGEADRLLWMSDIGWMVGPKVIVSATLLGATMVLADGAPDYPDPGRLWRLAAEHGATVLGIAPTAARALMRHGADEALRHDLSRLRIVTSAGEPWDPESWLWVFENVCRRRAPILNYSGGTEIGGAILIGTVHDPLKPCAFGGSVPGHGAAVLDEAGRPVAPGGVGELAMRTPSIGLTRGLLAEPERYLETYWSRFPDTWVHGDWASVDADGMWYIHGRSDDTIKLAGKRVGPAEVEALLMATGEVEEAAAVGVPDPVKGERLVCICVSRGEDGEPAARRARLAAAVEAGLGRAFRPGAVLLVADLPKTRNQKIMRRLARSVLAGTPAGDLTSLVNPEAVDELRRAAGASLAQEGPRE